MGTPCKGCGDKDVAKIATASEEIMERMDRLMPEGASKPQPPEETLLLTLRDEQRDKVQAKLAEISEVKRLHEKCTAELRGMLEILRPEGGTRFDTDRLAFFG